MGERGIGTIHGQEFSRKFPPTSFWVIPQLSAGCTSSGTARTTAPRFMRKVAVQSLFESCLSPNMFHPGRVTRPPLVTAEPMNTLIGCDGDNSAEILQKGKFIQGKLLTGCSKPFVRVRDISLIGWIPICSARPDSRQRGRRTRSLATKNILLLESENWLDLDVSSRSFPVCVHAHAAMSFAKRL